MRAAKCILVLDDSPVCLELARSELEGLGTVLTTESAIGFSALVRKLAPDVIVLDVNMPALNGDRVARLLRDTCQCPIILFSTMQEHELRQLAQSCGASGWLRKDAFATGLRDIVRRALSQDAHRHV